MGQLVMCIRNLKKCMRHLTICIRHFATLATLNCGILMCNRCTLKCEVIRETDGRNTLKNQCKGDGVGEPGRSFKQPSKNINICFHSRSRHTYA
jgi:hypothetical protein